MNGPMPISNSLRKAASKSKRHLNRLLRNPFDGEQPELIVHGCHHRTGTVWFRRVLSAVAEHYGLQFFKGDQEDLRSSVEVFMQDHSKINTAQLSSYRGSHMIRDPRDMVVSGYHFHKWTDEAWAHVPSEQHGGRTFQERLQETDKKEGLMIEIERFCKSDLQDMLHWDYDDPRIIEIKYEEIMANEGQHFAAIFRHYGFDEQAVQRSVEIARVFSFRNVSKRSVGDVEEETHLRSGKSKQWQDHFDEDHKAYFKQLAGNAVVQLCYEDTNEW